ncbi:MAG: hypothetical protein LUD41_03980 [Phascolarctobacterium sp.]|nr:hypothetical protein [Phascolarctobacterium sp.]
MYYEIINTMLKVKITPGGSDFRLMDRKAVDAFKLYRERTRFIRGLVNTLCFKVTTIEFITLPHFVGKSKFNTRKMLHFVLDGITAFFYILLRCAFYIGLICGTCSLLISGQKIASAS